MSTATDPSHPAATGRARARAAAKTTAAGTSTTPPTGRRGQGRRTPAATSGPAPKKATGAAKRAAKPAKPQVEADSGTSRRGPVGQAVQRDLDAIAERDPDLARSGLAGLALAMAEEIDFPNSATSKSMCAAQLREALAGLRALTPTAEVHDEIDDLRRRRAERTAARQSNP